jgi:hypothetical protein
MNRDGQEVSIDTLVSILTPKEIGVSLVPLQQLEETESSYFWTSVFLSFLSTLLGSIISLLATDYSNKPVLILLGIFSLIFGCLTGVFAYNSLNQRKKARDNSTRKVKHYSNREINNSITTTDAIYIGQLYKMMYSMQIHIFNVGDQIIEGKFIDLWKEHVFKDEGTLGLYEKLIDIGLLIRKEDRDKNIVIEFNYDFVPEIFNKRRSKRKDLHE